MHFIRYTIQTVFHPSSGLHNCREFYQPLSCLYQAMQIQEKRFLWLLINFPEKKKTQNSLTLIKEKFLTVANNYAFQNMDFLRLKCQLKRKEN